MKKLTLKDVEIEVITEKNDFSFRGEYDKEVEKGIARMVGNYGLWGWCSVEVKVSYKMLSESDYLGGCSYKSEKDFRANSGYYEDMVSECLERLNAQLGELVSAHCESPVAV